ncbi:hypothetical protein ACTFIV_000713 [Dictyostelium citrinum]
MNSSNSAFHEDQNGLSLYYSDLPVRSQILKDKYRFYGRKIIFYLYLAYFITAIELFPILLTNLTFWAWLVHTLYWETDLANSKHNIFIKILHPLSFVLSFVVMITSIILLIILNPEFIANRARLEGHSIGFAWCLNILIHWVPPVMLAFDLFLHKEHIRKRHRIFLSRRNNLKTWIKDGVKVFWCVVSPMILVAAWFGAGFTIQGVYGVTNYNLAYLIPSMCAVDIIVAVFFIWVVRKKPDSYIRLNS